MGLTARANRYIIGNDTMMIISFLVVLTRLYYRRRHSPRGLWWDDLFIVISLVLAIANGAVVNVSMAYYGWDMHIWKIPTKDLTATFQSYMVAKVLFILASSGIRMSLLCGYLSLVRDIGAIYLRRTIIVCMVGNAAMCLAFCLVSIFECRPVTASWIFPRPAGSVCMNDGVVTAILGGILTLADIIVNILPLPIVIKVKVPFRVRLSIGALLSLGSVATVAGIVREYWIYRAFIATSDSTWEALPLWICTDVEIYVGLLCACAPALKPLFSKINKQTPGLRFFRRKSAAEMLDLEIGNERKAVRERIRQVRIFDGTSFSNLTEITHDRVPPTTDWSGSRPSNMKEDSANAGPRGIYVETYIHVHSSRHSIDSTDASLDT